MRDDLLEGREHLDLWPAPAERLGVVGPGVVAPAGDSLFFRYEDTLAQAKLLTGLLSALKSGADAELLTKLGALMTANPELTAAVCALAGRARPGLAAAIGVVGWNALAESNASETTQARQIGAMSEALGAVNPRAAVAIFQAMANFAPQFAAAIRDGLVKSVPDQRTALDTQLIVLQPAAGNSTPPPANAPSTPDDGIGSGENPAQTVDNGGSTS